MIEPEIAPPDTIKLPVILWVPLNEFEPVVANPNAVICADDDTVPAGTPPPAKDDVATNVDILLLLPT